MNTSTKSPLRGALLAAGATIALGLAFAAPASAQSSVNISVGQPGFYGQLNIGGFPPPAVYYPQPVVIERTVIGPPVYLRVPEGHRRHWSRHCGYYNACGRQVFFVQDNWYNNTYVPRYREVHYRERPVVVRQEFYRERDDRWREHDGRGWDRGDHHEGHGGGHGHDKDHGNGHGNGHGKGHGKHGD